MCATAKLAGVGAFLRIAVGGRQNPSAPKNPLPRSEEGARLWWRGFSA